MPETTLQDPAEKKPLSPREQITVQVDEPFTPRVDADDLAHAVLATLHAEGRLDAEVTVVVTDDEAMRTLNRQYRDLDEATDVLSFGAEGGEDKGFVTAPEQSNYLGDIVIAYPYAAHQAQVDLRPVSDELRLLAVHGTLHLLGYDHAKPDAEAAMWAKQAHILNHLV